MIPSTELLPEHPFLAGMATDTLDLLAGCARNVTFAPGDWLFRAGEPAQAFFLIQQGRVALELHTPGRGTLVIDTVEAGEVAGWSWLVPPHRWMFDGRAVVATSAVALDGACLRAKCDSDPALGYELMQRVAGVMYERLQAARIRLLDLYGGPA